MVSCVYFHTLHIESIPSLKVCVGCPRVLCIVLHCTVCIFSHPTHLQHTGLTCVLGTSFSARHIATHSNKHCNLLKHALQRTSSYCNTHCNSLQQTCLIIMLGTSFACICDLQLIVTLTATLTATHYNTHCNAL